MLLLLVPIALLAFWLGRAGNVAAVAYSSVDVVRRVARSRRTRSRRSSRRCAGSARRCWSSRWRGRGSSATARTSRARASTSCSPWTSAARCKQRTWPTRRAPWSRLAAAKEVVSSFIQDRPDDRIGVIAFAGQPYLASPLTLDHDWVLASLDRLDSAGLAGGTAIGSAIAAGVRRLDAQGAKSKILIVLTDGQNNAGKIQPSVAAEAAKALGVKVYAIGVGSAGEAMVPVTDEKGRRQLVAARVDVDEPRHGAGRRDDRRQVLSRDGHRVAAPRVRRHRSARADRRARAPGFVEHDERFAWFAVPGLLLVLAELTLSATRLRRVP